MNHSFGEYLSCLLGKQEVNNLVALFSARLDEAGIDGRSPYTVVAGAVATAQQWDMLEEKWGGLLSRSKIDAFHWRKFNQRKGAFSDWGDMRRARFKQAQEKIINKNTVFRVSIGIESSVHAGIKERMRGIKGFRPDSDYGLCLRWLMFSACEQLVEIDKDCRLAILIEDGPLAAGAMDTYSRVSAMTGKFKPAKHAHRLAGFGAAPKGERLSLEAADYIAGNEHTRLVSGEKKAPKTKLLSVLLTEPLLEEWYLGMMRVKEARRKHWQRKAV